MKGIMIWSEGMVEITAEIFIKSSSFLQLASDNCRSWYKEGRNGRFLCKDFEKFPERFWVCILNSPTLCLP